MEQEQIESDISDTTFCHLMAKDVYGNIPYNISVLYGKVTNLRKKLEEYQSISNKLEFGKTLYHSVDISEVGEGEVIRQFLCVVKQKLSKDEYDIFCEIRRAYARMGEEFCLNWAAQFYIAEPYNGVVVSEGDANPLNCRY
jgi:hypothetical protein